MWSASFTTDRLGKWIYTVQAWVDHFDTWCHDLRKRLAAQPDPTSSDPAKARSCRPRTFPLPSPSALRCWTRPPPAPRALTPASSKPSPMSPCALHSRRRSSPSTTTRLLSKSRNSPPRILTSPSLHPLPNSLCGSTASAPASPVGTSFSRAPPPPDPSRHGTFTDVETAPS